MYATAIDNVIDFLPDPTFVIDKNGRVIAWNRAIELITGVSKNEIIGKEDYIYAIPFYGKRRPLLIDLTLLPDEEFEKSNYEDVYRQQDILYAEAFVPSVYGGKGAFMWGASSKLFDAEGNVIGAIETIRDVTARKKTQQALIHSEQKYRSIFDNVVEGIFQTTPDGRFITVNPSLARIYGYSSPEELIETITDIGRQIYVNPDERDEFLRIIKEKGSLTNFELQIRKKDGSTLWASLNVHAVYDENGKPLYYEGTSEDITSRKLVEAALKESENKYRTLYESSRDGVVKIDMEGRFVEFNNSYLEMLGYKSEELVGRSYKEITPSRWETEEDSIVIKQIIGRGYSDVYEKEYRRKDGSIISVELRAYLIKEHGKNVGIWGIVRDITERKQIKERLYKSESKYRAIFENAVEGIFQTTLQGQFVNANPAMARMLGYDSPEELMSSVTNIGEQLYVHPEDLSAIINALKEKGIVEGFELQQRRKDGSPFWAIVNVRAVKDAMGNILCLEGTQENITERKQAYEQLQTERNTFFSILNNAPYGILLNDPDGNLIFINPEATNILGYSIEEIPTGKILLSKIYPDHDYRNNVIRTWKKDVSAKSIDRTFSVHCKNATVKDLEFRTFRLPDGETVTMFSDITERKRAEEEKRNLQSQVIQSQKMEAIGQLAGGIAHDFNNLLTGIKLHAYLGKQAVASENPVYLKLKSIEEIVDSATKLTKQFLGFARGGKYEVKAIDLNDIIGKVASFFGRTRKEIVINKIFHNPLWAVDADQGQMEQVLLNLFVNAQHAMPNGGDIYIKTGNVNLDETGTKPYSVKPGRYISISVTDTGTGIDEKIRDRIFEPFFTTKERGIGTGLGLASVYGIVKNHGGYITVDSTLGIGSTFHIFLPASDKTVVKGKASTVKLLTGKETILLVDDEKEILSVTNALLEALGYRVYAAENGVQAVEIYKTHKNKIALVILDFIMPVMNGEETLEKLTEINPDVRVILASGYAINEKIQKIIQKGCRAFIQKPYDIYAISAKIRGMLDSEG